MRHALEMFDEFKYVPDHVKTQTIEFSLTVLQICIRYIFNLLYYVNHDFIKVLVYITILCMTYYETHV